MPLLPPSVILTFIRRSKLRTVEPFQVMKRFDGSFAVGDAGDAAVFHGPVLRITGPPVQVFSVEQFCKTVFSGFVGDRRGCLRVRYRGRVEGSFERLQRSTIFGDTLIGTRSHLRQGFRVRRVAGQIGQFIGVVLQIVQETQNCRDRSNGRT